MRLTVMLLLGCLFAAAGARSQTITWSGRNASLETVFAAVKKQTGYLVVADYQLIKHAQPVTIEAAKEPLASFLKKVLTPSNLVFIIEGNTISISKAGGETAPAGKGRLLITVTDDKGVPLEGASVSLREQPAGDVTGKDGQVVLDHLPEGNFTAEISFVGMEKAVQKVTVNTGKQTVLLVKLKPAINDMDETIVRGYGTVNRSANTGSIARVKGDELNRQNNPNPLASMQGRAAGVAITATSGGLGAQVNVQVRGINSVAAGAAPLYIIDGIPMSSEPLNRVDAGSVISLSPMNSINPQDIESIEILKDADATAIYGSRGSNGVILITTRKAKNGQAKFALDAYTGFGKAAVMMDMLDTRQYLAMRHEAFAMDGLIPDEINAPDLKVWDTTAYTNWPKLIYGNSAPVTNIQATLSGGDANTRFMAGIGYFHQNSILAGNENEDRVNMHFNIEHNSADKKLAASFTTNVSSDHLNLLGVDIFGSYLLPPNFPAYDADGKLTNMGEYDNPYMAFHTSGSNQTNNVLVSGNIRYTILPGLQLKTTAGYNRQELKSLLKFPSMTMSLFSPVYNKAKFHNSDYQSVTVEPQIDYTIKLNRNRLQLMAGGAFQHTIKGGSIVEAGDFSTDLLLGDIKAAKTISSKENFGTQYKYVSGFARATFSRDDKYFLNATFRRDGSSRFGPDNRFGNFGALGAAWLFSREDALINALPFLSYGKLRASYGVTGNDQISDYRYMETFSSTLYMYNNMPGLLPASTFNGQYGWEENRKLEAALELGFLRNRIMFTAAWFRNRCSNQLVEYPLPAQSGFPSFQANLPALLQNQGLELELSSRNINGKDFSWTTTANLSIVRNKLLEYPNLEYSPYFSQYQIGQPVNLWWGYLFHGVDTETGLPVFKDFNNDQAITFDDYTPLGSFSPRFFGGFNNQFRYKGFELDLFFQFSEQNGYNWKWANYYAPGTMFNVPDLMLGNYWQAKGDVKPFPRLTATNGSELSSMYSDYWFSNAAFSRISYLRLKNALVGWNFPEDWLKRTGIKRARVYLQSQNLLTFSNVKGLDPETGNTTPLMRTFTAGFQLSF
ncbi:MAG TPA: SusC/RagA family TonB-linked outer membrane protein [Pseudobacter sp.]|nr:SusC/RagA family TonB-linked outer membrane protein [Pseudobacter sp.]